MMRVLFFLSSPVPVGIGLGACAVLLIKGPAWLGWVLG